jgi:hypothetical protein
MRRYAPFALVLLLAACASDTVPIAGPPPGTVDARFAQGGEANVITVTAYDRVPIRNAALVAPDGSILPSYHINTERPTRYGSGSGAAPTVGIGVGGGSSGSFAIGSGIGLTFPLGGYAGPQSTTQSGNILSTAYIRLADPVDYRRRWKNYTIRVRLGDPPSDVHFVTLAAPPPP